MLNCVDIQVSVGREIGERAFAGVEVGNNNARKMWLACIVIIPKLK